MSFRKRARAAARRGESEEASLKSTTVSEKPVRRERAFFFLRLLLLGFTRCIFSRSPSQQQLLRFFPPFACFPSLVAFSRERVSDSDRE